MYFVLELAVHPLTFNSTAIAGHGGNDSEPEEILDPGVAVIPRVNRGKFPFAYKLPPFDEDVVAAMTLHGRLMASSFRRKISRTLAEDIAKYECGPWPNNGIKVNVLIRFLKQYPQCLDEDEDEVEGNGGVPKASVEEVSFRIQPFIFFLVLLFFLSSTYLSDCA